jgi:hypothetical protein
MAFEQLMAEAQMKKDKKEEKKSKHQKDAPTEKPWSKSKKAAGTTDENAPPTGQYKYDTSFSDEGWAKEKQ